MCGIILSCGHQRPFHHRQLKSLRKRGPDEIGFWSDDVVNLGHTRLSIIGLDERGTQPMEDDTHVLIFNGEIYNFAEIKARLDAQGIWTSGATDSEVLLRAWTTWGPSILRDLTGFWAFTIYNKHSRKLTLVRDQFGIKPLYYTVSDQGIAASSMIKTILEVLDTHPSLDYDAMSEYVRYQYTFGDKTFFKSIKKVLPGHYIEIDVDTRQVKDVLYEDILGIRPAEFTPLTPSWLTETRELLRQCVVESTISDTSFTTFCSGGLDSSLITRIAEPETAYHCNYSDPECNETFFAKMVVENTNTRLFTVNAAESFNLIDKLTDIVSDFDELTIGSVILPLDDLLAQVKRRYKVILTGSGGDELFAGYMRYQMVLGECNQDSYKAMFNRMKSITDPAARFELTHRKGEPKVYKFYQSSAEQAFYESYEACKAGDDDLLGMLRFDRRYFLQGLLNIDDKMCGRHSLESRPSLLHQKFVRHVQHLNSEDLFDGHTLKHVSRKLAENWLPRSVIYREDKMGFTTPIGTFVNNSSHLIRERLMDSKYKHLYDLTGIHFTAENKFSREVFGLLMLDIWLNTYAG